MKKNDVLIHFEWFDLYEESELTDEEITELIFAAIRYVKDDENPKLKDRALKAVWSTMKSRIDHDIELYKTKSDNGRRGGAPKGNKNAAKTTENNQKQPKTTETSDIVTVTDSVSVSVSDSVCVTNADAAASCDTHTREDVHSFFKKNNFRSDPDKFINYNIGRDNHAIFNNPRRWQAVARNWEKMEKDRHPPNTQSADLDAIIAGEVTYNDISADG